MVGSSAQCPHMRIWLHHNSVIFENSNAHTSQSSIVSQVWSQLLAYIRQDFIKLCKHLSRASGQQALRLHHAFVIRWGPPPLGPSHTDTILDLPAIPAITMLS
jgi:hypothetical protein